MCGCVLASMEACRLVDMAGLERPSDMSLHCTSCWQQRQRMSESAMEATPRVRRERWVYDGSGPRHKERW